MEFVTLNNGVKMPTLGLGVFQAKDLTECEESVLYAIQAGYRLIDTASSYYNEEAVCRAIKRSGVPREDLFITTKLWIQDTGYENTKKGFEESLRKLQLDYLDLYLIHQPFGDYYGSWRAMEELYKEGKIWAIGVANFNSDRLVDLILHNDVVSAVDQVEVHPYFQQKKSQEIMKEYGVQMEAWSPLGGQGSVILSDEVLVHIGEKYGKSAAQVILRWDVQRGGVTIPKSVHKNRIDANFDVFDFSLTDEEMKQIEALDCNRSIADVRDVEIVKSLHEIKIR